MGNDVSKKNSYEIELSKTNGIKVKTLLKSEKPKKGRHFEKVKTSRTKCWKCGFTLLAFNLFINIIIAITLWCTNWYYNSIYELVTFQEGGYVFKLWTQPAVPRVISVYPFNYTNIKAIKAGTEVPHVEQLGPYVFRETMTKVNIKFHNNGTFTCQENRTHEFAPELSKGLLSDTVLLPNFPVLGAHNMEDSGVLEKSSVSILKFATFPSDFLKLSVNEVIWGYDDRFTKVSSVLSNIFKPKGEEIKKFGILTLRNGLSPDRVTRGTGIPDLDNFSVISRYNGRNTIGAWNDEKCDKIEGTDGSIFPRKKILPNTTLNVFAKELCRKIPLVFEKEILTEDGIPAYRFVMPANVFECADKNPANKCFCRKSGCPPCGTFNTGPCNFRLPVLLSYPHFTHADPVLREKVTGLTPDPEKYKTIVDVNSYGVTVNGYSKLQINFFINQSSNTPWLNLADGTVLPLAWLELKNGEFTDFLKKVLQHLSYTIPIVEIILRYFSLFVIITFPFFMYLMLKSGKCGGINLQ